MPRLDHPRAEKERDYARQRVIVAEHPHLYVTARRKKKKGTQRAYRRKVRQLLGEHTLPDDTLEKRLPETVQRVRMGFYLGGTAPLGSALERRFERRAVAVARNLLKKPYNTLAHRERFAALLQGLTCSSAEKPFVQEMAQLLFDILEPGGKRWLLGPPRRRWLEAFFDDEPEWKLRLTAWILSVLERAR